MSELTTWFIFKLIGMGAAPDLSELQAFKKCFFANNDR